MASSVVSLYKREVREYLPGVQIPEYVVPAYDGKVPSIVHVTDSYYLKPDINGEQTRIVVTGDDLAQAIVSMHISSQICATVNPPAHPAVFYMEGEISVQDLRTKHSNLMAAMLAAQKRWYVELVKMADDDWQTNHRHVMISDIQRMAARELNFQRDWLLDGEVVEEENQCVFCASKLLNPDAPVCHNCGRVINPTKLKEIEERLAKTLKVQ